MNEQEQVANWFTAVVAAHDDRAQGLNDAYFQLDKLGLLSKVTLHRYQCNRRNPCQVARVVQIGPTVLCAVRDYKYSPGMNRAKSVPEARRKRTLNGDNWWPGHVYDVNELATWGDAAGLDMVCRHFHRTIFASDILTAIEGAKPGHPNKPTRLGDD